MSGKKNFGNIRMDGQYPPEIDDEERTRAKPSRHGKCPKTKGKHQFQLYVPQWLNHDRTGRALNLSVDEFYSQQDADTLKKRRIHETSGRWYWPQERLRHWVCMACLKTEMDSEESPSRKIRSQTLV